MKDETQRSSFLAGEGDAWFRRNDVTAEALEQRVTKDPLLRCLEHSPVRPTRVLEIGCSNGWRLELIRQRHGAECTGVEPSLEAVTKGRELYPELKLHRGTAEQLPIEGRSFDLVIFGYCLYLCDREDLFKVAAEADRVLCEGGTLAIYDFHSQVPYRNPFAHRAGLYSYKMDYARMFTWNPAYRIVYQEVGAHPDSDPADPDNIIAISILQRKVEGAFQDNPHK